MLQIREFLEKNYVETSGLDTVKLAIKALLETVEAGSKSIEVRGGIWRRMPLVIPSHSFMLCECCGQ